MKYMYSCMNKGSRTKRGIVYFYCYVFSKILWASRNSKLDTRNSKLERRNSILECIEYWESSFESRMSTYIWLVLSTWIHVYIILKLHCISFPLQFLFRASCTTLTFFMWSILPHSKTTGLKPDKSCIDYVTLCYIFHWFFVFFNSLWITLELHVCY